MAGLHCLEQSRRILCEFFPSLLLLIHFRFVQQAKFGRKKCHYISLCYMEKASTSLQIVVLNIVAVSFPALAVISWDTSAPAGIYCLLRSPGRTFPFLNLCTHGYTAHAKLFARRCSFHPPTQPLIHTHVHTDNIWGGLCLGLPQVKMKKQCIF